MKTKPFSELRKRMSPERREKQDIVVQIMLFHINLLEIQQSSGLTEDMKQKLQFVEFIISQLEKQEDIQLSTLYNYINALGITQKDS